MLSFAAAGPRRSTYLLNAVRATLTQSAICSGLLVLLSTTSALAQLAPNAPSDQPKALTKEQIPDNAKAIAPYVAMARKSYPGARQRFLSGLRRGQSFFLVTRLVDAKGHWEQVFIHVETIVDGQITGTIASDIRIVSGFKPGQIYKFPESDMLDWLISSQDGSEEGNFVGKFLDTQPH
jgi:hypothetical protein